MPRPTQAEIIDLLQRERPPLGEWVPAEITDDKQEAKAAGKAWLQWTDPPKHTTTFREGLPPRKILAECAAVYIQGLNWTINEANRQYRKLEAKAPATAVRYLETAMRAQLRALTITLGTTVRVEKAEGQEALQKWGDLPPEVRVAFDAFVAKAVEAGVDVAGLVGARPVAALPAGR